MRQKLLLFTALLILSSTTLSLHATVIVPADSIHAKTPDAKTIAAAMEELRSLSRKDRKERVKEVKKEWKQYKKEKRQGQEPSTNTLLLVILAILLPPLAVYLHEGVINGKFWLSLLLTLLFFLPGVIYALIVVLDKN